MSNSGWEISQLNSSHVIRLDENNYHAYCIFISMFGEAFYTAQQLQSEGILDRPYKVAVVIPRIEKFKEEDAEDNLTRMKFIINNFVPPKHGIAITFYEHWQEKKVQKPYGPFVMWPYKKQWDKNKAEDYVTIQRVEEIENNVLYPNSKEIYDRIIEELKGLSIEYKTVDYTTPIEELFDTLLKTKLLISYPGSSYYIAGGLGTPCLGFGDNRLSITDNYEMRKHQGSKKLVPTLMTAWGNWCLHHGKIVQFKNDELYNAPQTTTLNIGKVETLRDIQVLRNSLLNGIH
jgi:hypothetical protein